MTTINFLQTYFFIDSRSIFYICWSSSPVNSRGRALYNLSDSKNGACNVVIYFTTIFLCVFNKWMSVANNSSTTCLDCSLRVISRNKCAKVRINYSTCSPFIFVTSYRNYWTAFTFVTSAFFRSKRMSLLILGSWYSTIWVCSRKDDSS